jgi:hypothetical protein
MKTEQLTPAQAAAIGVIMWRACKSRALCKSRAQYRREFL